MSPNNAAPDRASMLARLNLENVAWQTLMQVLRDEEQALIDGAADRLAPLNASKLVQLEAVSDHARSRLADLRATGHTPDHAGMDAWLTRDERPESRRTWQQLCEMEREAQAINQRIGALIELRLSTTRQALNVLVHSATRQSGLYDHAGLAVASHKGKPLTAA